MEQAAQAPPMGYGELIRGNGNFRFLWFGQIVSLLGDWFNLIASASLLATHASSGVAIGILFAVRYLAPFLVSPLAGVAADRYSRKAILIVADLLRAVIVLAFLLVRSPDQVWLLYTLTALQLAVGGFFFPARNAILPQMVSPRGLGAANTISATTWAAMLALGAALGGLASGTLGVYPAFVIDSATFLLSAGLIARITLTPSPRQRQTTAPKILHQYLEGLSYLRRHPDILIIALNKPALALFLGASFDVVQVNIAKGVFVLGEGGGISMGLMFGVTGLGTALGPLVAHPFIRDRERALRRAILLAYLMSALGLAIVAPLTSLSVVLLGLLLRGAGDGIIWTFSAQLLLQKVPHEVLGRVISSEFALFALMSASGAGLMGQALDTLPLTPVMAGLAGLALIPAALWALWPLSGPQAVPLDGSPPGCNHSPQAHGEERNPSHGRERDAP